MCGDAMQKGSPRDLGVVGGRGRQPLETQAGTPANEKVMKG